jgi:hypothetical protein
MTIESTTFSRIAIVFSGVLLAGYICVQTLLSKGSILGELYLYVAVGAFLLGLFSPRASIFALILCTAYIDFFKRLMVLGGNPDFFDVACSLATPPLLCAGSVINLTLSLLVGKKKLSKEIILTFLIATTFFLFSLLSMNETNSARGFGGLANGAAYPYLMLLIPTYFPNTADKLKLIRWIYICFIGVALYMFKHYFWGLAGFEIDYLNTNLSLEARILNEDSEVRRCFSTMNGAGIVSTMCALMFFWSFVSIEKASALKVFLRWTCALIYATAAFFTLSRTGWICGLVGLVAILLFRNFKITVLSYIVAISLIVALVALSPVIMDMNLLSDVERELKHFLGVDGILGETVTTLGTFNGRLLGWKNLMTKSIMWTPFGWKMAGLDVTKFNPLDLGDDTIVWSLIKYGYIPFFVGGAFILYFLLKLHKFICSLPMGSKERNIGNLCLATIVGIMFGGLGNGAQLAVFPLNVYLFMCMAFVFSLYTNRNSYKLVEYDSEEANHMSLGASRHASRLVPPQAARVTSAI